MLKREMAEVKRETLVTLQNSFHVSRLTSHVSRKQNHFIK